ncbi:hypothetical protein FEDK69T_24640 [Flavobacterium enshiense DK69]|nr:hypothetical protein FEDK69T_24640 [Flavobacterium enshiense DK69]
MPIKLKTALLPEQIGDVEVTLVKDAEEPPADKTTFENAAAHPGKLVMILV